MISQQAALLTVPELLLTVKAQDGARARICEAPLLSTIRLGEIIVDACDVARVRIIKILNPPIPGNSAFQFLELNVSNGTFCKSLKLRDQRMATTFFREKSLTDPDWI